MQARYLGYEDGPRVVRHADIAFRRGEFRTVPEAVAAKLAKNRFFEVQEGEAPESIEPEPELTADPEGVDATGEKDEVIRQLEALQARHPELEFSARWGLPRLKSTLEEAQFEHGED